ncbi:hypothetical protein DXV75_13540 [Alteromonas aestuariivivens]|uniref:PepSY domain-containing protein n=1 Tax=Alteromonas aestuariivivens TaxID=1938339 RepID=A0A3D8M4J1_9ALTE|nr:PepSY domain-containing protein [Alteromonas aestuariivivens]RDV24444.1 hypothetical protein DXV75_13540 [Alteromonas aestuariivivens]
MASVNLHNSFRKYHRWLGFFLAGIMAVYAVSGVLLVFRKTDFLKYSHTEVRKLQPGLSEQELAKALNLKDLTLTDQNGPVQVFKQGQYNQATGQASLTSKDYPVPLAKMVKLHKATTGSPLYILNITFGVVLLFFVISAFVMFIPRAPIFRNGLKIAATGFLFAGLVVMFGS